MSSNEQEYDLSAYLLPKGKAPGIGPERGRIVENGISKYISQHGSTRYVYYVDGVAVSALQVVSRDGRNAIVANVYTLPAQRRHGWASRLIDRARKDFVKMEHADPSMRSDAGNAWARRVNPTRLANPRAVPLETIDIDDIAQEIAEKAVERAKGKSPEALNGQYIASIHRETLDVKGRRASFAVSVFFQLFPSFDRYVVEAQTVTHSAGMQIYLHLNCAEGARIRVALKTGVLQEEIRSVLTHEFAHVRTVRYGTPKYEAPETGKPMPDWYAYYNDPLELHAFTAQVVAEARSAAKRIRGKVGTRLLIDRALEQSPTWHRIQRYMYAKNVNRVASAVARDLEGEEL